nr:DUF882 domain-containing protein [Rhodoplanes tepidamans]
MSNVRLDSATGMVVRAGRRVGLAALVLFLGCDGLQTAAANGDTRTLTFHHTHTGESLTVTYRRDGRYDDEALKKINWVMRDWRRNKAVRMDPAVIDAVWELTRSVDATDVDIICGYRAPETNSMLRARSGGVAKASQHMLGKAIDLKVRGVSLEKQRAAAMRLHRGGVGYYPGSQFIHVDTASIRHWPRMTYDQLARVFPDGRTVHVPSNGKPLPGYQLALADLQKRGSSSAVASAEAGSLLKPGKNLLASLFGGARDAEEDEDATRAPAASPKADTKPAARPRQTRIQTAQADIAKAELRPEPKLEAKPEARPAAARVEVARPAAARVAARPAAAPAVAPAPAGPEMFALASASSTPVQLASAGDMPVESTAVAVLGGAPPRPPAELGSTDMAPTAAVDPQPVRTASADPMAPVGRDRTPSRTGSLWSRERDAADRVPLELALAYATEPDRRGAAAPARAPAMGSLVDRARLSAGAAVAAPATAPAADGPLTVVKKIAARVTSDRAGEAAAAPRSAPAAVVPVKAGMRFDDPWLRAVMLTPSLHAAMTVTSYGDPDYVELRSLMGKPTGSVVMAFGSDPYPGLASNRFSGGAVVFVSTVTFRTAALR